MKQITEIEIEFSEIVAYSRRGAKFEGFCPQCESSVEMYTPHAAAILSHTTERGVYRLIESGKIHFIETDGVLVCLNSLTRTLAEPTLLTSGQYIKGHITAEILDGLLRINEWKK